MIDHNNKIIFVHVPKCAGQSIELFFLQQSNLSWENRSSFLLKPNNNPSLGPPRLAHLISTDYVKLGHITKEKFNEYFKFSFVRNPFSRVISFYNYLGYNRIIDFDIFIFKELPHLLKTKYWFFQPQTNFIYDLNDNILVDFLGKFENIDADFKKVITNIQIENSTLPFRNKSVKKEKSTKALIKFILNKTKSNPKLIPHIKPKKRDKKDAILAYNKSVQNYVYKLYERDFKLLNYNNEIHKT